MTTAAPAQQELPSVHNNEAQQQHSRAILLPVDDTDVGRMALSQSLADVLIFPDFLRALSVRASGQLQTCSTKVIESLECVACCSPTTTHAVQAILFTYCMWFRSPA